MGIEKMKLKEMKRMDMNLYNRFYENTHPVRERRV